MKTCSRCKRELPYSSFSVASRSSDGRQWWCRDCANKANREKYRNNEQYRAKRRAYQNGRYLDPAFREQHRLAVVCRKWGITADQYADMLVAQDGRCAICRTDEPGGYKTLMSVDHDHACCPGQTSCGTCVRGLLCTSCNNGLGRFRDDPSRLRAAADYLESA